jgi:hypothetical protein
MLKLLAPPCPSFVRGGGGQKEGKNGSLVSIYVAVEARLDVAGDDAADEEEDLGDTEATDDEAEERKRTDAEAGEIVVTQ